MIMSMSSLDTLPVILVTAKTQAAAAKLISEIVKENEGSEQLKENVEGVCNWLIQNKYYKAHVRLQPLGDDQSTPTFDPEAHVIALGSDEGVSEAESRATRVSANLLLAAIETDRVPSTVTEWAVHIPVEVVPLCEPPASPSELAEPFSEERGVRRLREALHAHVWPNLRRHGVCTLPDPDPESDLELEDAADDVERAELFAAALGALGPASRHVAGLSGTERCAAAEALVAEFARALGVSLDEL